MPASLAAVAAKTGAEAEACCQAGAVLAGAPETAAYAAFGRLYGTAVQLVSELMVDAYPVGRYALGPAVSR